MPKRAILLNYQLCNPQNCEEGVCRAALMCKRRVLCQPQPYEVPELNAEMCLGCAICTTVCNSKALQVLR